MEKGSLVQDGAGGGSLPADGDGDEALAVGGDPRLLIHDIAVHGIGQPLILEVGARDLVG